MTEKYIVFDVETPNARNDRMSAIGVSVVENGQITWEYDTLVNPETYFNAFNVNLTGITPEMAERAPTFPEVWRDLEPVFSSGILVAHNAPFDMGVLAKCLRAYCIDWDRRVPYACTCRMSRWCYRDVPNHRLNTLSTYLGIKLDHHRAGSDSRAAALLLIDELACGVDIGLFTRNYDLLTMRTVY